MNRYVVPYYQMTLLSALLLSACDMKKAPPDVDINEPPPMPAAPSVNAPKYYRTIEELFLKMPEEVYPVKGRPFGIERAATNKWCKDNLIGSLIEWTEYIEDVEVEYAHAEDESLFSVKMITETLTDFWEPITFNGEEWRISLSDYSMQRSDKQLHRLVPADEAKFLRNFKGKEFVFRGRVLGVDVEDGTIELSLDYETPKFRGNSQQR